MLEKISDFYNSFDSVLKLEREDLEQKMHIKEKDLWHVINAANPDDTIKKSIATIMI